MYPLGDDRDPKSATPTGYKKLSNEANALTPTQRVEILKEITTKIKPEQMKAFQQAAAALNTYDSTHPQHSEFSASESLSH